MRNDIDALVERVRAVAMDNNRPSTPGSHSHIDWAGDDDDSLPDLDDWGVTPATFASSKSDVISPLIVGSLKSLPDVTTSPFPSSPLKQSSTITKPPIKQESQDDLPTPVAPSPPVETEWAEADLGNATSAMKAPEPEPEERHKSSPVSTKPSVPAQGSRSRKPLHPSLPAKPAAAPSVSQLRARPGAAPMRTYPKSPVNATKDNFDARGHKADPSPEPSIPFETPIGKTADENISSDIPVIPIDEKTPHAPENLTILEPTVPILEVQSAKEGPQHKTQGDAKPEGDEDWGREGLSASIHAPKAISDSVSAPPTVSTYPDLPSERHLTHTRAHTVGRPPSFPKSSHNEYVPRFTRSGHSTPRSAFQGQQHIRTQSTPPAGVASNQQRAHRPIITGDAISRLARTIGKTGISSTANTKPQPVGSPGH